MKNLSWEPKPKDWPADFDGTVSASAHGGVYRIEALGDASFRGLFIRDGQQEVLSQVGRSRRDGANAVYEHRRNMKQQGCRCHLCGEGTNPKPAGRS